VSPAARWQERKPAFKCVAVIVTAIVAMTPMEAAAPQEQTSRGFHADVSRISPRLARRMRGKSWHRGCPVPIRRLRLIRVSYHGFDGDRHIGRLVANRNAVEALVRALRSMYRNDFKIRRMWLVDRYGGNDRRSMRADNTSVFNCRFVSGTTRWSEHAYGRAIDINPVENPYVRSDGTVSPRSGRPYVDRSRHAKGMIHAQDATVRAFSRVGWGWGGYWRSAKDYQHFSASGN
jgi:D-alanyl-D-alanine carboxypeptidase-like protein